MLNSFTASNPCFAPSLAAADTSALLTFLFYTAAVFGLAALSSQLLKNRDFLKEYFLGSRSLGVWALALTFAATSASGGSFTGFPSLIYMHGWVLALWIASYMIFPICTMGLLGKRINQVARKCGAITVPDILRDRFNSPGFAILATVMLVFFTCVNLVGQFKAGSMILQTLLGDNTMYLTCRDGLGSLLQTVNLGQLDPGYVMCLLTFGVAVIIYTTWGGFHAVVWTDVMQGIVMVFGVVIMLPLAIGQVGGMENATRELAAMVPPHDVEISITADAERTISKGEWLRGDENRIFRAAEMAGVGESPTTIKAIEVVDTGDRERIESGKAEVTFSEDLSVVSVGNTTPAAYPGDDRPGSYVTAPGPSSLSEAGFLPMSLAFSMFFYWAISGTGQPGNMVRLMAFRTTKTLRISIATVAIYFSLIYFPLVIIFCCSRLLLPGMEVESDRVMPQMAVTLTSNAGFPWLAGLLIAAPFAAVMSTVDSFLLMISSSVVRDIYQRNINPQASQRTLQKMSYLCTILVGTIVVGFALNPPQFLQYLIVYVGSGLAACFLAPVVYSLYWRGTTRSGAIASMAVGFLTHLSLYLVGWYRGDGFTKPWRPFTLDPVVIGIGVSFLAGYLVSLITAKPDDEIIKRYFYRRKSETVES